MRWVFVLFVRKKASALSTQEDVVFTFNWLFLSDISGINKLHSMIFLGFISQSSIIDNSCFIPFYSSSLSGSSFNYNLPEKA